MLFILIYTQQMFSAKIINERKTIGFNNVVDSYLLGDSLFRQFKDRMKNKSQTWTQLPDSQQLKVNW